MYLIFTYFQRQFFQPSNNSTWQILFPQLNIVGDFVRISDGDVSTSGEFGNKVTGGVT